MTDDELFRLDAPELPQAPLLISAIDSWIDAGLAAARARTELAGASTLSLVGTFDAEALVDHQARRPVMHLVDGVNTGSGSCADSSRPSGSFVPCMVPDALYSFHADPVR